MCGVLPCDAARSEQESSATANRVKPPVEGASHTDRYLRRTCCKGGLSSPNRRGFSRPVHALKTAHPDTPCVLHLRHKLMPVSTARSRFDLQRCRRK